MDTQQKPLPPPQPPNSKPITTNPSPAFITVMPEPILPSTVPPDLSERPFIERAALVLSFGLRSLEYNLSPYSRNLRGWFKLWCFVFLYTGIPVLFITPVVSYLVHEFTCISHYLLLVSQDIFYTLVYATGGLIVLILLLGFLRSIFKQTIIHLFK